MALKIEKDTNYGVSATYWKIIETNINYLSKNSRVVVAGYIDQKARDNGKEPLAGFGFDWNGEEFPFSVDALTEENPVKIAYEKIKKIPEWELTEDV
jgi:hypothetical protein